MKDLLKEAVEEEISRVLEEDTIDLITRGSKSLFRLGKGAAKTAQKFTPAARAAAAAKKAREAEKARKDRERANQERIRKAQARRAALNNFRNRVSSMHQSMRNRLSGSS